MQKNANYFPAIDGLRLVASLNIVFLHLASSGAFSYAEKWTWLKPIVSGPAFSAGMFFVLAGFLFGAKFEDPARKMPVVPFMFSRIAKLYRLHFICTLLMFIAVVGKFSGLNALPTSFSEFCSAWENGISRMDHPVRSLLLHFSLLWSLVPNLGMKLNEPSWALTSFFICYALTPSVASILFKVKHSKTLWLLLILSFLPGILQGISFGIFVRTSEYEACFRFFHMFFPMHVCEYFLGMILFRLYREGSFSSLEKNYVAGICQALLFALLYLFCYAGQNWVKAPSLYFIVRHSLPILISGLLIVSLIPGKGFLASFFKLSPVRAIGRASFYPYLLHLPLITIGWGFFNMNTPLATIVLVVSLYAFSVCYLNFKNWKKKRKKKLSP